MSGSGCLFDFDKLNDVSKNVISRMSAHDVYVLLTEWAKENDPDYYALLTRDSEYAESILSIGRGGAKPRKDLTTWADAKQYMNLFYDELFGIQDMIPEKYDKNDVMNALQKFILTYNYEDVQSAWFEKIKDISESLGYASDMKEYKQNPEAFKGNVGDISMFIRVAVTGKLNSPDMYEVMRILGYNTVINRIKKFIKIL
ncbi:hypothetical protein SDC9_141082 [bioreactor metagenome]|uniref:Aminoacyl-tRNA synthetase class I anticodon-binding domain-containing protein n=1 Tax=bioreactor metagenome TaxID=1076179 RepID=A0A645DWP1_9ZZZZ